MSSRAVDDAHAIDQPRPVRRRADAFAEIDDVLVGTIVEFIPVADARLGALPQRPHAVPRQQVANRGFDHHRRVAQVGKQLHGPSSRDHPFEARGQRCRGAVDGGVFVGLPRGGDREADRSGRADARRTPEPAPARTEGRERAAATQRGRSGARDGLRAAAEPTRAWPTPAPATPTRRASATPTCRPATPPTSCSQVRPPASAAWASWRRRRRALRTARSRSERRQQRRGGLGPSPPTLRPRGPRAARCMRLRRPRAA